MALAISNLHIPDILSLLGVSTARDIFYNGTVLKTVTELGALVKKEGLSPAYCPGATNDDRLSNLLNDRSLKYFKGYDHVSAPAPSIAVSPGSNEILFNAGTYNVTDLNASHAWTMISKPSWVTAVSPPSGLNGLFGINITVTENTTADRTDTIVFKLDAYTNQVSFTITQVADIIKILT